MVINGAGFAWFVRLQITPALSLPKWIIMGVVIPPSMGICLIVDLLIITFYSPLTMWMAGLVAN